MGLQGLAHGLDFGEVVGWRLLLAIVTYKNAPLRLINVYAPAVWSERLAVLQRLPPLLATSRTVILAGDFNCNIDADGRSGAGIAGGGSKRDVTARFLMDTVKDTKLLDVFSTPADGAQWRYTWSRPDGSIRSRIDFLFVS
eukprot:g16781.t1